MRGRILHFDTAEARGTIRGSDGNRYTFRGTDLARAPTSPLSPGLEVEFTSAGAGRAGDIVELRAEGPGGVWSGVWSGASSPSTVGRDDGLWTLFLRSLNPRFRGRARRREYWSFSLFAAVFYCGAVLLDVGIEQTFRIRGYFPLLTVGYVLGMALPSIAVGVRRLHDLGMSGWAYLLCVTPFIGGLILFVLSLIPGQNAHNRYGPDPKRA